MIDDLGTFVVCLMIAWVIMGLIDVHNSDDSDFF